MIGQCFSTDKFNVIILAAGAGSRMGDSSMYIPKALSPLGEFRAIDWLIMRYANVAHKFIIGVHTHADLLVNYVQGRYKASNIEFVYEDELVNNARSATLCLDRADSRYPTIIQFCDLIMLDNFEMARNTLYIVDHKTEGVVGSFRHFVGDDGEICGWGSPRTMGVDGDNGLLGVFSFGYTPILKSIAYENWYVADDLTEDIVAPYQWKVSQYDSHDMKVKTCAKVVEFGNESDLRRARELWEKI